MNGSAHRGSAVRLEPIDPLRSTRAPAFVAASCAPSQRRTRNARVGRVAAREREQACAIHEQRGVRAGGGRQSSGQPCARRHFWEGPDPADQSDEGGSARFTGHAAVP